MRIQAKNLNSRQCYKYLLVLFWGKYFIVDYIRAVIQRLPIISGAADAIINIIYLVLFILSWKYIRRRVRVSDVIFIMTILGMFILNYIFFPNTSEYLTPKLPFIFFTIVPLYFIGIRLDLEKDIYILYKASICNLWLAIAYKMMFGVAMTDIESLYQGDMSLAYNLLPQVCLIILYAMKEGKALDVFSAIIGSIFILSCGTRGAMLLVGVYFILYFILFKKVKKPLVSYPLIIAALALAFLKFEDLFVFLLNIAKKTGMSIRVFDKIVKGNFLKSGGRNQILEKMLGIIRERPVCGYGIGGDFATVGSYSHNIVIEFIVSFGIVLGIILLLSIIYLYITAIIKAKNTYEKGFVLVILCSVIGKLMMSNTYLNEMWFLLGIGICINVLRRYKRKDNL